LIEDVQCEKSNINFYSVLYIEIFILMGALAKFLGEELAKIKKDAFL